MAYEVQSRTITPPDSYRMWDSLAICANEKRAIEERHKWIRTYERLKWPMEVRIIYRTILK